MHFSFLDGELIGKKCMMTFYSNYLQIKKKNSFFLLFFPAHSLHYTHCSFYLMQEFFHKLLWHKAVEMQAVIEILVLLGVLFCAST